MNKKHEDEQLARDVVLGFVLMIIFIGIAVRYFVF